MKVWLFLDFDGVLNNIEWFQTRGRGRAEKFDPDNIRHLNGLIRFAQYRACRALEPLVIQIVVSSSWRIGSSLTRLRALLGNSGFWYSGLVVGMTPVFNGKSRGDEISAYMRRVRAKIDEVAILDDDSDFGDLACRHVKTHFRWGLRPGHVRAVLKLWGLPGRFP